MQADIDHIHEIEAVSQTGGGARDPIVVQSWLRCLEKHRLDPAMRSEAYILPETTLRHHRQRSEDLIAIARSGIDGLYRLVAGQNYVLLLADSAGVTVEYLGEDAQKQELRQSGLYLGAEWSEARAGTCALGACIESGEPLIIHQSDHFDATHGGLSCTAAPIFDSRGQLTAVLDISLLSSPRPREGQFMALNLVRQAARRIEMANIMAESRREWVLRLAACPDFLDVDPEAALSLDASGHVIGMTNGAARLMARTLGVDWRDGGRLIGRHVSDIFAIGPDRLEELTRRRAAPDRFIETRDGYRLFAHAIEPQRLPAPRPARGPRIPDRLRALAGEDPAMRAVLEQAAALAGAQVPVLIAGESGAGKSTLAQAIHDSGRRGPCIRLSCETVEEDEAATIFGREDRRTATPGLIEAAAGGTLVLDNPERLPDRLRARLTALVAGGVYRPVGALRERRLDARIVLTTTAEPDRLRDLAAARLVLPPLRQRLDLPDMAERVLSRAFGVQVRLDASAVAALARHDWRGNLHELSALALTAAAGRAPSGPVTLTEADLPRHLLSSGAAPEAVTLARHLHEAGWNISAVARRMGMDRSTVHRQIRRNGLSRPN